MLLFPLKGYADYLMLKKLWMVKFDIAYLGEPLKI